MKKPKWMRASAAVLCLLSFALSACKPGKEPPTSSGSISSAAPPVSSVAAESGSEEPWGPLTIGKMKLSQLFYTPPESGTVYYIETQNESPAMILALRCLQGLVAREEKASIFLAGGENDRYWRMYLESEYAVNFQNRKPAEIFSEYREHIRGLFLYDESRPELLDAILTAAACENCIPVTGSLLPFFEALNFDKDKQTDYRSKWSTAKSAYEAVLQAYGELLHPNYIFTGAPGGQSGFIDYAYAVRAFFMGGSLTVEPLATPFRTLLGRQGGKRFGILFGSGDNRESMTSFAAPFGYAYLSCGDSTNTTFFASLPAASKSHSQPIAVDRKAVAGKRYISLIVTDSMNLSAGQEELRALWEEANNSILPFAFQLSPLLSELSPAVLNWYYQNRSSHSEILASTGGFASIDAAKFPADLLPEWFRWQDYFLSRSGIRLESVWSLHGLTPGASGKGQHAPGIRPAAEETGKPPLLRDAPEYLISHGPLDQRAFAALMSEFAAGQSEESSFHCIYLDLSRFDTQDIWEYILLQVKTLQLHARGRVEFLLPGDLMATAKAYTDALLAASSEDSEQSITSGQVSSSNTVRSH